jgi:lysophospholipase L1-like esterase
VRDGGTDADATKPTLADAQDVESDVERETGATPRDARADAVTRLPSFIVVLGSSTAAGFGLSDPKTSWVQRYATYLSMDLPGSRVTNLAVSGYSTYQIQPTGTTNPSGQPAVDPAHNVTAALALHPDAIIVNMPSNDAAMGIPVETTMTNLKTVAAQAMQTNVLIWVTTSQPRQLPAAGIALLLGVRDRTEQEFGDRALDFFTPLAAPDGTPLAMYNQGDGIHPNAEGHRLLFEQVQAADLPAVISKLGHGSRD